MAFGPATTGVEQALLAILQGRQASPVAPVPLAPTGGLGPLSTDTSAALAALQPEPVPPALPGPVDAEAIRSQFAGMAGPEPVAPTVEPTSLVLRIARALQGFGAGVQGQGPQFLEQLRQEREAPMREFRARKERFDVRKQDLELAGEQAILTAEDRRMERSLKLLDEQADRDFKKAAAAAGLRNAESLERLRGAIDMERDAKKAELEQKEQDRKDAKERRDATDRLVNTLVGDFRITRPEARRFAEHEMNGVPLSPADAKKYARIEKYRPSAGGSSGGGSGKVMVEIRNTDGSLSVVPYAKVAAGVNSGQLTQGPRGVFIEGQPTPPPVPGRGDIQGPFVPPSEIPQPPAGTVFTRAEIQAHAKKTGKSPAEIEAALRARGKTIQ